MQSHRYERSCFQAYCRPLSSAFLLMPVSRAAVRAGAAWMNICQSYGNADSRAAKTRQQLRSRSRFKGKACAVQLELVKRQSVRNLRQVRGDLI